MSYCRFVSFINCCHLLPASSFIFFSSHRCGKINKINAEEEAYGWALSQYPQHKNIQEELTPFLRLYETATDFLNQYELWLHGPLGGVNPDKVWTLQRHVTVRGVYWQQSGDTICFSRLGQRYDLLRYKCFWKVTFSHAS